DPSGLAGCGSAPLRLPVAGWSESRFSSYSPCLEFLVLQFKIDPALKNFNAIPQIFLPGPALRPHLVLSAGVEGTLGKAAGSRLPLETTSPLPSCAGRCRPMRAAMPKPPWLAMTSARARVAM